MKLFNSILYFRTLVATLAASTAIAGCASPRAGGLRDRSGHLLPCPGGSGMAAPAILFRVMRAQSRLIAASEMAEADILIAPAVSVSGTSSKDEHERAIQSGYETAVAALSRGVPEVRSRLAEATALKPSVADAPK
jgi:hypothetical protein